MIRAIILAGGKARRLRPLTGLVHKAILRYKGKRLIEYAFDSLYEAGYEPEQIVVVGPKGHRMDRGWRLLKSYVKKMGAKWEEAEESMVKSIYRVTRKYKNELNNRICILSSDVTYTKEFIGRVEKMSEGVDVLVIYIDRKKGSYPRGAVCSYWNGKLLKKLEESYGSINTMPKLAEKARELGAKIAYYCFSDPAVRDIDRPRDLGKGSCESFEWLKQVLP